MLAQVTAENRQPFWFELSDAERAQAPLPWGPQNPQALNRYAYGLNNPVRWTDPTGYIVKPPPCDICDKDLADISQWPKPAQGAAIVVCFVTGWCHVDEARAVITGPTYQEWLEDYVTGTMPTTFIGGKFAKAGINVTEHFLRRLTQRGSRGVTEEAALRAYNRGRLYYNPNTRNYIRYDPQTGVAVVVDRPTGGTAITVFEGNPSPDWIPVRWRPGS